MKILISTIILSVLIFVSSCKPNPGDDSPPATYTIAVENPQWLYGTGNSLNWDSDNDADYKIKVKVQTLDENGNATLYNNYSFTKNYTEESDPWENETIEVPSTGNFVIQVELIYLECTYQNTVCNADLGGAGKKEYYAAKTYPASSPNQTFTFPSNLFTILEEECNCN